MALAGVNLGGWLVLEKWMVPAVFAGTNAVDEYTFMQTAGAKETLRSHHRTFITEQDFQWLHAHHIQAVRIPVGYWILDGDAPYISSIGRLDWAFLMCEKYQLKLLLDIHGLPGSQNGRDHSGKQGGRDWVGNAENMAKGLDATVRLAKRYATHPALWGIEIMNEPQPALLNLALRRYYQAAYVALSAVLPPHVRIIYPDAFTPRLMNGAVKTHTPHPAVMDIHWYHFLFPWAIGRPWLWLMAVRWHGRLMTRLKRRGGVIVGEWSGVYDGRVMRRYPAAAQAALTRESIAAQLQAYQSADAWFYWSYKTEGPGVWNFRSLVDDGTARLG